MCCTQLEALRKVAEDHGAVKPHRQLTRTTIGVNHLSRDPAASSKQKECHDVSERLLACPRCHRWRANSDQILCLRRLRRCPRSIRTGSRLQCCRLAMANGDQHCFYSAPLRSDGEDPRNGQPPHERKRLPFNEKRRIPLGAVQREKLASRSWVLTKISRLPIAPEPCGTRESPRRVTSAFFLGDACTFRTLEPFLVTASTFFQVLRTNQRVPIVPANSNTEVPTPITSETTFGTGHGSKPRVTSNPL